MIIPLVYRDQSEGVLVAIDSLDRATFNDDDQQVLELFAARATLALGMARSLQSERERAEAEVMLLRAEQRSRHGGRHFGAWLKRRKPSVGESPESFTTTPASRWRRC